MKAIVLTLLVLAGLSGCGSVATAVPENHKSAGGQVTIERDQYGTPHVYANDAFGVYYGYGYALAQDRLFQIEMLKRTAQGRVSEVLGSDYVELDKMIRTAFDHRSVRQQVEALNDEQLAVLEGYAQGINRHVDNVMANPDKLLPVEFTHHDFLPSKWTAYDAAMQFVGSIAHRYSEFNSELDNLALLGALQDKHGNDKAWQIFNASKWLLDEDSPTTVPVEERPYPQPTDNIRPDYLNQLVSNTRTTRMVLDEAGKFAGTTKDPVLAEQFAELLAVNGALSSPEFSPASNFWAVDRTKLSDADGALVNGPQFGWGVPSYVYGIGLHGGGFDVVGNTLLGLPSLLFAHNNSVSWGSTAGLSDQVDVFIEQLHPQSDEQYLHNGVYKRFDSWQQIIKVRNSDDVKVMARRSVHGMVQSMDVKARTAVTRARAWEGGELASMMAWVFLAKDKSLDAVKQRLEGVTTNINFYYMDNSGELGYTHGGRYPKRQDSQDPRFPTPGTGEYDWLGFRPYSDNPTTRSPKQGYIANWNNRPSADWISIDLWSYTWARGDRARLLFDQLESKKTFSAEEVWSINEPLSYADVTAPFLLPHLLDAFNARKPAKAVGQALQTVRQWDQQWKADRQGNYGAAELIWETWLSGLLKAQWADDIGEQFINFYTATNNPNNQLGASMGTAPGSKALIALLDDLANGKTPVYDFFNGRHYQDVLRDSFVESVALLQESNSKDMRQWTIAAAPMTWQPNNFRGVPQAMSDAAVSLTGYLNRGSENNYFIARNGVIEGFDVVPPGQSGFVNKLGKPGPNNTDQMNLFKNFELKPIPFTREQVKAVSVSTEVLELNRK